MARPAFKGWWTRIIPKAAERSTYVLFSCIALFALFAFWQPMGGVIWNVSSASGQIFLYGLFDLGWVIVLVATFLINHFDLFGLRHVWLEPEVSNTRRSPLLRPGSTSMYAIPSTSAGFSSSGRRRQ